MPSPIYEGEDSVIAWMLSGKDEIFDSTSRKGEAKRAIMDTYEEHSANTNHKRSLTSLLISVKVSNFDDVDRIMVHTSSHSLRYWDGSTILKRWIQKQAVKLLTIQLCIFSLGLQDGEWHHVKSYAPERAQREDTVRLWHKIETCEDPEWTKRYHDKDPNRKA